MYFKQMIRFLHATGLQKNKSALATLRKKTGYPFSNCKKALDMHNNDIVKSEEWLKQQAQALGWSKATKLEGRNTSQGLIGVLIQNNIGAMVEVNCETDFVARNEHFHKFVENVTATCTNYVSEMNSEQLIKIDLLNEKLKDLKSADGKTLADHLALMIGTVGENAILRRAICFKGSKDIFLHGYTHPTTVNEPISNTTIVGKYGSIVAFKSNNNISPEIQKNLCQHIVGMNPAKLGDKDDEPREDKDEETCLIHQEYLLDPEINVGELLETNQIDIIDFQRYECGENDKDKNA